MSELKPCQFITHDEWCNELDLPCQEKSGWKCNIHDEINKTLLCWRSAEEKPENYSAIIFKSKAGIFSVGNYDSGTMRTQNGNKFSFDIYVTYWIPLSEVLAVIE